MQLLMVERNEFKWTDKLACDIIFSSFFLNRSLNQTLIKRTNTNLPAGTSLSIDSCCAKLLFAALP
jgi:hypothetical protein